MPKHTDVINKMTFSYSNINTFETCRYAWYLTYIEKKERRTNFYSEFGSFAHNILEDFFLDKLAIYELLPYYKEHYTENIKSPNPFGFGKDLGRLYYDQGYKFFENFDFDKSRFDIIQAEEFTIAQIKDIKVTIKPDIILRNKENGKTILVDYKSSNPYLNGKLSFNKIIGYRKQINLYAAILWHKKKIETNEMWLWFFRTGGIEKFPISISAVSKDLEWFFSVVKNIKCEESFEPNTGNKFFCSELCGVRYCCPFKDKE